VRGHFDLGLQFGADPLEFAGLLLLDLLQVLRGGFDGASGAAFAGGVLAPPRRRLRVALS
jgi:hypothetical protein